MEAGKVEIRYLGSLELTVGASPVPVSGARQRRLVAALAVHRNRTVALDALAAAIWADDLPADVPGSVQSLVSRLRRALPAGGGAAVRNVPGGYCLAVEAGTVDADRFAGLLAVARARTAGGGDAAVLYRDALALWRGPALGELAAEAFAQTEAARLDRMHAEAISELAECELAAGSPGAAVDLLEPYVREHPLHERARAALMLGLYRLGRQADALAAYRDLRRELDEQLGLEPTAALRALEQLILRQDPSLDAVVPLLTPADGGFPLPPVADGAGRIFVGRGPQLDRCLAAWAAAAAGRRGALLVGGEPGIGKTRLAAEAATRIAAAGGLVLGGRCDEDLGVPYQPFVEALRHYLAYAPDVRTGRHGGELARLVPEIGARVPGLAALLRSDPETERYRLFDAVAGWLAAVSADRPVLLLLDDLQWAAKPTLLLLRHVLRSAEPLRLLVLATYRDTETGATLADLLADLRADPAVERLGLGGLDEAGVLAYLEAATGRAGESALARDVWAETEGNPFFVAEVVRNLDETDGAAGAAGVPEGVREVVGRRLRRLPAAADRVLAVGAVAGLEFDPEVVRLAGGFGEEDVLAGLEAAVAARLLVEVPGPGALYRFAHALVRATVYGELTAVRRAALHRHIAEALEATYGAHAEDRLPALAHHWARAGGSPAAAGRALECACQAGDRAVAQLAHDEAVAYFRQALDLLGQVPDEHRRLEVLVRLGEAQRRGGDPAHRATLLHAARLAHERGDTDALARAVLANQRGFVSLVGAIDAKRLEALEWAVAASAPGPPATRARLLALLAAELHFCGDDRPFRLCREALEVARGADDLAALAQVLATAVYVLWGVAPPAERSALAAELAGHAERLGDPMVAYQATVAGYYAACEQPDLGRAEEWLAGMRRLAGELGQPLLVWRTTYMAGVHASATGRFDLLAELAEDSLRLGEAAGQPDAYAHSRGPLSIAHLMRGRPEDAAAVQRELVERFPGITTFRALLAWSCAEAGAAAEARAHVEAVRGAGFAGIARDYTWPMTLVWLANAAAVLGDARYAAELAGLLPEGPPVVVGATVWLGPMAHSQGRLAATLGSYDEADRHFADAAAQLAAAGASGMAIHTDLAWADALQRRAAPGDAGRAAALAARAAAAAAGLGHPDLERRAKALA